MTAAPLPTDELERLAELRELCLLDTPAEERFDRVTRLASQMFGAPLAYVALVDENRQWFKSSCGVGVPETSREISLCAHAILCDEMMVVSDTRADPRFRDNPLVTGDTKLRFYAGQPLRGPRGHKVGTLCIADHRPREFSDADRASLSDLAKIVERELGLSDMIRLQDRLIVAQEATAAAERARAETLSQLVESQRQLSREINEAERYVRSLLPARLSDRVASDWCYHPCSKLGGDAFGYYWLDDDHFAIYLLDACGHGVGSALLSTSAIHTLRSQTLPNADFHDPSEVLSALNRAFPMEEHGDKFFTIWYGVYRSRSRRLTFASAGHPPAVLLGASKSDAGTPRLLGRSGFVIGMDPNSQYETSEVELAPADVLYLFSDGVYEVMKPDGVMMEFDEWVHLLAGADAGAEALYDRVRAMSSAPNLADDFSLVRFSF